MNTQKKKLVLAMQYMYVDYTGQILKNVPEYKEQDNRYYTKAKKQNFSVSQTLQNKLKKAHKKHYGRPSAITEQEETTFIRNLIKMSQNGFPL